MPRSPSPAPVRLCKQCQIPPDTTGFGFQRPLLLPGDPTDDKGRYRYIPDGKPPFYLRDEVDFVAIPNRDLENGVRLEDWLPEYEIDWDVCGEDRLKGCYEAGNRRRGFDCGLKGHPLNHKWPYVVFFMGAECNNLETSRAGHNRGALWSATEWEILGRNVIKHLEAKVVVVGAGYDASYYEKHVLPLIDPEDADSWINAIAEFSILETLEICSQAKAVVSYQSGIGIMSHYLNVPTAIWWRPEGDSIVEGGNLTFDERMASAWMYPGDTKSLPMVYGRESVEDIIKWMEPHL